MLSIDGGMWQRVCDRFAGSICGRSRWDIWSSEAARWQQKRATGGQVYCAKSSFVSSNRPVLDVAGCWWCLEGV